jgi:hypothetical protein
MPSGAAAPVEGVAEDQTEGDVVVPQARAYRPECSVRSEGSATQLPRLPPSYYGKIDGGLRAAVGAYLTKILLMVNWF